MKLSIITINFNNEKGLKKTLDSVACQIWCDFEHIIVDGASSDGSVQFISNYCEQVANRYPIHWISEPDKGIYNAMNKGIRMALGEYCLFLNSGDWLIDEQVLDKVFALEFNEDVVYGFFKFDYGDHFELGYSPRHVTLLTFVQGTIHHTGNAFIRRDAFERWGLYDESLKIVSDWKWFLQTIIFHDASYRYIDILLSVFDCFGISSVKQDQMFEERERVLHELLSERILQDYQNFLGMDSRVYEKELEVRSSLRYRIGNMVLCPFMWMKKYFNKKNV